MRDIIAANPDWADVNLGNYADMECVCGCRTVVFAEPAFVQNPKGGEACRTLPGQSTCHVALDDGKDDYISVLLHHSWGKLTYLEVIWYNFRDSRMPSHWTELGRRNTECMTRFLR